MTQYVARRVRISPMDIAKKIDIIEVSFASNIHQETLAQNSNNNPEITLQATHELLVIANH